MHPNSILVKAALIAAVFGTPHTFPKIFVCSATFLNQKIKISTTPNGPYKPLRVTKKNLKHGNLQPLMPVKRKPAKRMVYAGKS
jgi:hypothetical protein